MSHIVIRPYTPEDVEIFAMIRQNAILHLAKDHYADELVKEWAGEIDEKTFSKIQKSALEEIRIIAAYEGYPAGLGCVIPEKEELRACYVSSYYARKGVGSAIVLALEGIAAKHNVNELHLESSLNARAFYEKNGYRVTEEIEHILDSGHSMKAYSMTKKIQ